MRGSGPARVGWLRWLVAPFRTPASAFGSSIVPPPLALLELGLFALIVLLEWQLDSFPDISRFKPHPYWLAVLLLSLQYGTIAGLLAASIAIIGAVLIGLPPPDVEERHFDYLLRVWSEPILWLLVALLLGAFRARQIEKMRWLVGEVQDLEKRGNTVVAHAANLKARIETLERRLAVRDTAPQDRLLSALAHLANAKPGRWPDDLATVGDLAFPGAALSLYVADERRLRLRVRHRWPGDAAWQQDFAIDDPLARAILIDRRTLNVAERDDEIVLAGQGVAAVPIYAGSAGATPVVIGMLKLERASAQQIDEDTAVRLSLIAHHVSPALSHGSVQLVESASAISTAPAVIAVARTQRLPHVRALRWLIGGRDAAPKARGGDDDTR